jgi:hypothetical protein
VSPSEYRLSVSLTRGEIARYNFRHIRWLLFVDAVGLGVLLAGVFFSLAYSEPGSRGTLEIFIFWGVLLLAVGLSQPFILFLQIFVFKTPAVLTQMEPRVYTFDDDGIHIAVGPRTATTFWPKVSAVKDIGRLLLIYTSPKLAYVIPKRYFASIEERQQFVQLLLGRIKAVG